MQQTEVFSGKLPFLQSLFLIYLFYSTPKVHVSGLMNAHLVDLATTTIIKKLAR